MAQIHSGLGSTISTVDPAYKALTIVKKGSSAVLLSANSYIKDSFDRLRVAQPNILFEYNFNLGLIPDLWNTVSTGAATIAPANYGTAPLNSLMTDLSTLATAVTSGYHIQTNQKIPISSGSSTIFRCTFVLNATHTSITQRIGMFTDQGTPVTIPFGDGYFLERAGLSLAFVRRSYTSKTQFEERIYQNSWNIDPCDGTGVSKYKINTDAAQHLVIEISSTRYDGIRFGFETGPTGVVWAHYMRSSISETSLPLIRPVQLPIRAEIFTTQATGEILPYIGRLSLINCSVIGGGNFTYRSWKYFSATSGTAVRLGGLVAGAFYPVLALRASQNSDILKSTTIIPTKLDIFIQGAAATTPALRWVLLANPTPLTGATYAVSPGTASSVTVDIAATGTTAVTGTQIYGGVIPNTINTITTIDLAGMLDQINRPGYIPTNVSSISGPNSLCLAVGPVITAVTTAASISASISWKEISG